MGARVAELAADGPRLLGEAATDLARRPGKLIRPALLLLSALAGPALSSGLADRRRRRLLAAASAFELLHLASLTHDDILDASPLRRGEASVWGRWGPGVALLTGDYLYGKAVGQASLAGRRVSRSLCRTIEALLTGEAMQVESMGRPLGRRSYMALATAKTAVFCQESCGLGASLGGADTRVVDTLRAYGRQLGRAYQLTDDLLDWQGDPAETGKPRLADLARGHLTFPVIAGLARRPARVGLAVRAAIEHSGEEALGPLEDLGRELEACGALGETAAQAHRCVESALARLAALPPGAPRSNLAVLAGSLLGRKT